MHIWIFASEETYPGLVENIEEIQEKLYVDNILARGPTKKYVKNIKKAIQKYLKTQGLIYEQTSNVEK